MCECIATADAVLAEHNARLAVTFGFPRDGSPAYTRPTIQLEKIETRKPMRVVASPSFCPFCGERYEKQGAVQA